MIIVLLECRIKFEFNAHKHGRDVLTLLFKFIQKISIGNFKEAEMLRRHGYTF